MAAASPATPIPSTTPSALGPTSKGTPQPYQNLYYRRLVAADKQKSCYICYKPTSTVLITPDNRDFFYVCPGHLKDRGFAVPQDGEAPYASGIETAKKKKDEELQKEIEKVVKEYEEKKKRRKKEKNKKEEKDADGKRVKDDDDDFPSSDEKDEAKVKDAKVKELEAQKSDGDGNANSSGTSTDDEGPRVFVLHRNIFDMRTQRVKDAQAAKKRQEQMRSGTFFPAVPKGSVG